MIKEKEPLKLQKNFSPSPFLSYHDFINDSDDETNREQVTGGFGSPSTISDIDIARDNRLQQRNDQTLDNVSTTSESNRSNNSEINYSLSNSLENNTRLVQTRLAEHNQSPQRFSAVFIQLQQRFNAEFNQLQQRFNEEFNQLQQRYSAEFNRLQQRQDAELNQLQQRNGQTLDNVSTTSESNRSNDSEIRPRERFSGAVYNTSHEELNRSNTRNRAHERSTQSQGRSGPIRW